MFFEILKFEFNFPAINQIMVLVATWWGHISVIAHFLYMDNGVPPAIAFGGSPHPPVWPAVLPWNQRGEQKADDK